MYNHTYFHDQDLYYGLTTIYVYTIIIMGCVYIHFFLKHYNHIYHLGAFFLLLWLKDRKYHDM